MSVTDTAKLPLIDDDTNTTYTAGTNVAISSSNVISSTDTDTTYDSTDFLPTTGGTVTSGLQVNGKFKLESNIYAIWHRTYSVNSSSPQEILDEDGTALETGGAYRVVSHIDGTGTDQSSSAVFWNQDGTWKVNVTAQAGTSSNHQQFHINASGKPAIKTWHASNYNVQVFCERMNLNENTGTDNTSHYFGSDAFMSNIAGSLVFNNNGSTNKIFHAGNDGSGSGLDADLLDGQHGTYWGSGTGNLDTTYSVQDGGLSQKNFTTTLKNKLDGIATGATAYTHPTSAGNKHIPSGGSADQVLTYSSSGTAVWAEAGGSGLSHTLSTLDPTTSTNPDALGHFWINSTSGETFVSTDITAGANIWTNLGDGTGDVAPMMVATGGTVTTSGDYKIHTFNSSSNFVVNQAGAAPQVEHLVLAGGGGGASSYYGGGGGAGGILHTSSSTVSAGTHAVTVGSGGIANQYRGVGATGGNSSFMNVTASGGGGGSSYNYAAASGGSGGGASGYGASAGSGISGQGTAGSMGSNTNGAGGGGGAGNAGGGGANNMVDARRQGGNGLTFNISGSAVVYGGGGSACSGNALLTVRPGGTGGGGRGGDKSYNNTNSNATDGTDGLGGGGGGAYLQGGSYGEAGDGGNGVVIIKYKYQS